MASVGDCAFRSAERTASFDGFGPETPKDRKGESPLQKKTRSRPRGALNVGLAPISGRWHYVERITKLLMKLVSSLEWVFSSAGRVFRSLQQEQIKASKTLERWKGALERSKLDSRLRDELLTSELFEAALRELAERRLKILRLWGGGKPNLANEARTEIGKIDEYCSALYDVALDSFVQRRQSPEGVGDEIGEIARRVGIGNLERCEELLASTTPAMDRLMSQFGQLGDPVSDDTLSNEEATAQDSRKATLRAGEEALSARRRSDDSIRNDHGEGEPSIRGWLRFEEAAFQSIRREVEQAEKPIEDGLNLLKERCNMRRRRDRITKALRNWKDAEGGDIALPKMYQKEFDEAYKKLNEVRGRFRTLDELSQGNSLPGYDRGNWRRALDDDILNLMNELKEFAELTGRIRVPRATGNVRSATGQTATTLEDPPPYSAVNHCVSRATIDETLPDISQGPLRTDAAARRRELARTPNRSLASSGPSKHR